MTLSKSVLGSVAALSLTVVSAFASVPAQTSSCNYMFNTNLRVGAVSTDVQNLQKLLNMDAATRVASTGAGSAGYETLRFGPATLAAVKKFQTANGITPVSGYVGPLTRAALNTICTGGTNTTPGGNTNTGSSGVSSNAIPVSVLVEGQASAKLGEFVVTGNGMVTTITLQRTGLSNNSTLRNVYLYDGNTRITDSSSVRTDGSISFVASNGLFAVNGSKTITVRADLCKSTLSGCSSTSGQTVGVALTGVTMMGGQMTPVNGVAGPLFSISSASTATANFTTAPNPSASTYTSTSPMTITAGSMNQTLWSNQISISTNPVKLNGATFKMIGSAPSNAISNVTLYVDGVNRGTATINSMNQFVFAFSPVSLTTGGHTIEVRGDVVNGADRTFYLTLERGSDLMIEDSTLPGILVSVTSANADLFNANAGTIKVQTGTLTITQDTTSLNNSANIVGGASNQKLAAFKVTAYGEDVKITTLTVTPTVTSTQGNNLANVGLYLNGAQVGSSQTATNGTNLTFNGLGSNLYLPAGQTVTLEIRGDLMTSTSTQLTSGSVSFALVTGSSNAQGVSSYNVSNTPSQSGQSLTIGGSGTTLNVAASSAASTKSANSAGVKIGSFTLQTGSSEGITLNQVVVTLNNIMSNQLTNLTVKDASTGNTVATPIGSPTASTNNFSTNISIPANTTKVFDVYADFGSSASGSVTPSMSVQYIGASSNINTTISAVSGVATTIGTPAIGSGITFVSSNSPVAQYVVGSQSSMNMATFNVKTSNNVAGATLNDLHFTVTTSSGSSIGSVTVAGKTASVVNGQATVQGVGISVPADNGGVNIPVTVSLVCVGASNGCAGVSGATYSLALDNMTYNNGIASTTIATLATSTTPTYTLVASKPTVTYPQSSTSGLTNGNVLLGTVTVSADAAGDIELTQLPISITGAGGTAPTFQNVMLKDSSGSSVIVGTSGTNGTGVLNAVAATSVSGNFVFTTPRKIAKGTSETYTIYGTVASVTGAANTVSVTSVLGAAANFLWNDVVGGTSGLTGAAIYNYPTNTQTKTN